MKYISNNAFFGTKLTKVFIPKSVIFPGSRVFSQCPENLVIYCEAQSKPENWNNEWNHTSVNTQFEVVWNATRESI